MSLGSTAAYAGRDSPSNRLPSVRRAPAVGAASLGQVVINGRRRKGHAYLRGRRTAATYSIANTPVRRLSAAAFEKLLKLKLSQKESPVAYSVFWLLKTGFSSNATIDELRLAAINHLPKERKYALSQQAFNSVYRRMIGGGIIIDRRGPAYRATVLRTMRKKQRVERQ